LVGFAVAEADPGEEVAVDVVIPPRGFAHWDSASAAWAVEPGTFQLAVGRSNRDLPLTVDVSPPPAAP
jgi:beta-glucosidase